MSAPRNMKTAYVGVQLRNNHVDEEHHAGQPIAGHLGRRAVFSQVRRPADGGGKIHLDPPWGGPLLTVCITRFVAREPWVARYPIRVNI